MIDQRGVEPLAMQIFAGIVLLVIGLGIGYAVYSWAGGYATALKCNITFNKLSSTITKPGSDTIQTTVEYTMGTKADATLSATGEPTGVSVIFQPITDEPTFYSNMTVTVDNTALAGSYVLTITAKDNSGSTAGSAPYTINIQ